MKVVFTTLARVWVVVLLSSILIIGCEKEQLVENPDQVILGIPEGFPAMVFPKGNEFTTARWKLGKKIFYDPILSIDGSVSCASCHKANLAFADDRAFSPGVENRQGVRNAPSLANIGYHPYFLREGSVPTLEMQVLVPVQEENEFDHDMLSIAQRLKENPEYVRLSKEAYNREPDPFLITRALSNFQRTLISGNSPYDQMIHQGKTGILSESEKRGMNLFFGTKAKCSSCHSGFNFTDYSFQNNGLDTAYSDLGRARLTSLKEDEALFKVPSLRNVEVTAPYMHNGQFNTLMEVVEHYNSGGKKHPNKSVEIQSLNLTQAEMGDLVAFLKSLTDDTFINNELFNK